MKTLLVVVPMALAARGVALGSSFSAAEDDPKVVETRCYTNPAQKNFRQFLKNGEAIYRFDGDCVIKWDKKPGDFSVRYEVETKWTPKDRTAYETAKIYNLGSVLPGLFQPGQPSDYIAYVARYLCEDDPWRTEKRCGLELLGDPGNLRDLFPEVAYPPYPFTRRAISPLTRAELNEAYARAAASAVGVSDSVTEAGPGIPVARPAGVSDSAQAGPGIGASRAIPKTATGKQSSGFAAATTATGLKAASSQTSKFLLSGAESRTAAQARYGAGYAPGKLPTMNKGQTQNVTVQVTNNGTLPWTAKQFNLSYHWYQGANAVVKEGIHSKLSGPVATNQTTTVNARVRSPSAPGTYTLKWDMAEGNTYFSTKGARTGDQTVIVK